MKAGGWRGLLLGCMLAAASGTPGNAQVSGGIDVGMANDYVWRGLTAANPPALQPAGWLAARVAGGIVAGGVWSSFEPWRASRDQLTTAGRSGRRLAETDVWLQYTARVSSVEITLGGIGYLFAGDTVTGGRGSEDNTAEIYLRVWPEARALPVEPSATLFYDPVDSHSAYLELKLSRSIPVFPFWPGLPLPFGDLLLQASGAGHFGSPAPATNPRAPGPSAGQGVSHLDLAATATRAIVGPAYVHFTAHHQWNVDRATRRTGVGEWQGTRWWFEYGLSVPFGPTSPS